MHATFDNSRNKGAAALEGNNLPQPLNTHCVCQRPLEGQVQANEGKSKAS